MKKHSFSVILLAASLLSAGFVTSCKDNDSDMFTELDREQATLKQALQSQISDLESKISALENKKECTCAISEEWAKTLSSGSFEDAYTQYYAGVYATQADLSAALDSAKSAYDYACTLLPLIETNADSIVAFQTKLITINSLIDQAQKSANDALRFAQNDSVVLRDSIGHLRADLGILGADLGTFGANLGALTDTVNGMNGKVTQAVTDAAEALAKAIDTESRFEALSLKVDTLSDALSDSCAVLRQVADSLYSKAVSTAKSYADGLVVSLNSRMSTLETLVKTYENRIATNESAIKTLKTDVSSLKTDVAALKSRLSKLESRVSIVEDNLKMLITGIIIQGTEDPIFGYAALPFGIQTNILAGYYGDALINGVEFPTTKSGSYVDPDQRLTNAEKSVAGFTTQTYAADTIYAGKIYFTLNPSTVDFTNVKGLTLESSAENASPIHLKDVKKSTEELWFGITRAGDNGFYEATAYILPNEAPNAAPHFDLTAMKQVGNQLLNEKTFDLSSAVSALYQSVSRISPRYGLKAAWKNADSVNVAVYSNYAAATVAVQPLSYNFLYGKTVDLGYTIPSIDVSAITDAISGLTSDFDIDLDFGTIDLGLGDLNFDFSAFDSLNLKLEINWKDIEMNIKMDSMLVKFAYEVPEYAVDIFKHDSIIEGTTTTVQVLDSVKIRQSGSHIAWDSTKIDLNSQMGSLSDSIAKQINTTMSTVIEQITSFSNQLDSFTGAIDTVFSQLKGFTSTISGLQNSIDSVFTSVSGSLKTNINDMVSGLTDKISDMLTGYVSTVNSYITQINNVISNVTSFISDPNSKLQPVLLYTTNGGASSYLSASKSAPTAFKLGGTGEQGAQLVATSYTGELLAPAYKKYIAVVNVTDPDGNSAQGNNAQCLAAAKLANNSECFFNTVLDGGKRGVVFTTSDAYVGYTYEIAYAAVDYSGNMVARRFYVKVTK